MKKVHFSVLICLVIFFSIIISYGAVEICPNGCINWSDTWFCTSTYHQRTCECGKTLSDKVRHEWDSDFCNKPRICTICGYEGSNGYTHSLSKCEKKHCTEKVCTRCGEHQGTCGGDCQYVTCDHCKNTYCPKCETHSCVCNNDGYCSDPHCEGITWCTICESGTHICVGCNTEGTCDIPHCTSKTVCSICKNHDDCDGGHKYGWITDSQGSTQTHTYKCIYDGCNATNGTHRAEWGQADSNHTSICQNCVLTYKHDAVWSTNSKNSAELHSCNWQGGCIATHSPVWGEYYVAAGGTQHARSCKTCGTTEYHGYTIETWEWEDSTNHSKICNTCGIKQTSEHNFSKYVAKSVATDNSELYKHWTTACTLCNSENKEVDELHKDNGSGICLKCGQILWKIVTEDGTDITKETLNSKNAKEAFREAKSQEVIKIIEVVDNNGSPKTQYIKTITGPEILAANSSNEITITKNGEYKFATGRGGTATFVIDNISESILVDKILDPMTATTGNVKITVRTNKSEEGYNKKVFIKEGKTTISDAELKSGKNPYSIEKTVTSNGVYYFTARDTAGNVKEIAVVVDNIVKGQASVAISNDVFVKGYIFTDILVNPNEKWTIDTTSDVSNIIKAKSYETGSSVGIPLTKDNIKVVKIMDAQRKDLIKQGNKYTSLPGTYYIHLAIGGSIFNNKGTYIIDLENVNLPGNSSTLVLQGKNRIIVEVQDFKDLT